MQIVEAIMNTVSPTPGNLENERGESSSQSPSWESLTPYRNIFMLVAKRLVVAWAALSLAIGALTYVFEMRKIDEFAANLAITASQSILNQVNRTGEIHAEKLRDVLSGLLAQNFIRVQVQDLGGHVIAEASAEEHKDLIPRLGGPSALAMTNGNASNSRTARLTDELVAEINIPLKDQSGKVVGRFYGAYRVDANMRRHAQSVLVRNMVVSLLAVLVTTLTFYPIMVSLNRGVLKLSSSLMHSNLELMEVLGNAIAKRDSDTDLHNYRVCLYCLKFAETLHLPDAQIRAIVAGALLHDVGKIGIRDAILLKPGKLDDVEFEEMKKHVQAGVDIVSRSPWLSLARNIIEFHHERYDGSGYLKGLAGDAIPLSARLFTIVDVFDALTSRRPYKDVFPLDKAMCILEEKRGTHLDPALLDVFEPIAAPMYAEIGNLPKDELSRRLRKYLARYFMQIHYRPES
jgi:HD-GYP domain-containing protein (c-di-GMP phosphodiesterase class II)